MRFIFFTLILGVCLSCSEGGSGKSEAVIASAAPKVPAPISPVTINHPCDVLTGATVAQDLGWEGSIDPVPTTMRDGRLQSCFYSSTNSVGAATITVSQSSERTIERKGLAQSFAKDLASTDGPLTYRTISDGFGDETIYGYGKRGPNHNYRLRWRTGDHTEYSIDMNAYKKLDEQSVLEKLKVLAAKM